LKYTSHKTSHSNILFSYFMTTVKFIYLYSPGLSHISSYHLCMCVCVCVCVCVVLKFKLRASHILGRRSTACATPPALLSPLIIKDSVHVCHLSWNHRHEIKLIPSGYILNSLMLLSFRLVNFYTSVLPFLCVREMTLLKIQSKPGMMVHSTILEFRESETGRL
jgi:hypothetical protein